MRSPAEEEPRAKRVCPQSPQQLDAADRETEKRLDQLTTQAVNGFEEWVDAVRKQVCGGS